MSLLYVFHPFLRLHLFASLLCSSAILGEGRLSFFCLCANVSQVLGMRAMNTEHTGDEHRAYGWWVPGIRAANTITERLERAFTLYYRWIGSLIKKGEAGEGGRFYVNNIFRWTKTSFRGNFQNEMIRSNRNNRCQIIFKTLLNPFWQDNYLTLLIDFSKVRFPPDKTLIL